MNAIPLIRRFKLRPTNDSYIIVDESLKGPCNVVARFDLDEKEAAQKRHEDLSKPLSRTDITEGFNKLKQELQNA